MSSSTKQRTLGRRSSTVLGVPGDVSTLGDFREREVSWELQGSLGRVRRVSVRSMLGKLLLLLCPSWQSLFLL